MRVLHVDRIRFWGGGQNQIRLLMRELDRHGIEQLCLCPTRSPLESRLRDESLPVRGVTWNTGNDPRAFVTIARAIRQFDIVHCHDAHSFQLALAPAKLARVPIVVSRRVDFRVHALTWNRASRVIAISEPVRDHLVAHGVHRRRICLVHSSIDIEEVAALEPPRPTLRELVGIEPDRFLAGNVARLVGLKQQTLIPAAAARTTGVSWVIVGDGPRRAAIAAAIAANRVADRVRLAGALADARRYLRELDVFVFTSRGEAFGTSIVDAMAQGVPVIVPDDGGPGMIMRPVHERTGVSLYTPGDAEALAVAVRRVHDEPALRDAMVAHQNERLRDFRIQDAATRILSIYNELVGR